MRIAPLLIAALAACAAPRRPMAVEAVSRVKTLEELMYVQATYADPQFKKIDAGVFSDADFAALIDAARHLQASSQRLSAFSKGAEFDALAGQLGEQARSLETAAQAKDAPGARQALSAMKQACKTCHTKFR